MIRNVGRGRFLLLPALLAATLVVAAGTPARAQETPQQYWHIPIWAMPGAWQDYTHQQPATCVGLLPARPDSLRAQPRTVTVRFLRNRRVEADSNFGGYRIYRVTGTPDTARMMLIRRFSLNVGDSPFWHNSRVNRTTLEFECGGEIASDSVMTFVDPDSNGVLQKVCRLRYPQYPTPNYICRSPRDSVWILMPPPGPHDGFRTWYAVTYEAKNAKDNNYEDWYVPDPACASDPANCTNLNNKAANMTGADVEPSAGPAENLGSVAVVPNPFRGRESWDSPAGHEIHFINLPQVARIRIYSVDGSLVRELRHDQSQAHGVDFERWDLKNGAGNDVVSGIYMVRVDSGSFTSRSRFVVIR